MVACMQVDVWSVGIIFYQMLYGKRPFGHSMSQENILREKTIINAKQVDFPSKPSVSSEAKDFIKRCLTYRQAGRPDVHEAVADAYLTPGR
jgi:tousled-like kinase